MEFTNLNSRTTSYDSNSDHRMEISSGFARPILQEQDLLRCLEENSDNSYPSMDSALNLLPSSHRSSQVMAIHQNPQCSEMITGIPKVIGNNEMMHGEGNLLYNPWGRAGSSTWSPYQWEKAASSTSSWSPYQWEKAGSSQSARTTDPCENAGPTHNTWSRYQWDPNARKIQNTWSQYQWDPNARKIQYTWSQYQWDNARKIQNTWSPYAPSHTSDQIHGLNMFGASLMADAPLREAQGTERTCKGCGTTETPMWRNGPAGRKSLCNACGIKYYRQFIKASEIEEYGSKREGGPRGK